MSLDIRRISHPDEVRSLAPALADLTNSAGADAPHYRPIAAEEVELRLRHDPRFRERAVLVAEEERRPVGWCHLEPHGVALTGGDLHPYVGAHTVFAPGTPHVPAAPGYSATTRGLLYAACQIRAQQGAAAVELFAPEGSAAEEPLRAEGFQPVDHWATYVAELTGVRTGRAPLHVAAVPASGLARLPEVLAETRLLQGEFTAGDLLALIESTANFDAQGLLVAETGGEVVGYAAVMLDPVYSAATGCKRAWLGFGPLGLGALPGPEQTERFATLLSAARISAFCREATELAFVASAEGHQTGIWAERGFQIEVKWQRWRTDL